jgi:hypothetical protein
LDLRLLLLCAGLAIITAVLLLSCGAQLAGLEMDDPWYMWFAWRLAHGHLTDPLFGAAGTQMFGRVWVWLLSQAYAHHSWHLGAGHLLSAACIYAAALIWVQLGRRLGLSWGQVLVLAVLLIVYHPFLRAALSARPEAFIWLLASLALLCLDIRLGFLAGLLAGLAAETHPMGLVVVVYLAAWIWRMLPVWGRPLTRKLALQIGAGLVIAFLGYLSLHGTYLLALWQGDVELGFAALTSFRTPIVAYLAGGNLLRRAAALLLIAGSSLVYLSTGAWRKEKLPLYLLFAMGLLFVAVPRANELYFVYVAPVFLLALVCSLTGFRVHAATVLLATLPCLGVYIWLAYNNRAYSESAIERVLQSELGGADESVLTTSAFWPALRCQANIVSVQDYPREIQSGDAFFVLLQSGQNLALDFPRDTEVRHIRLGPRADFLIYHVHPQMKRIGAPVHYPDCPDDVSDLPRR